MKKPKAKTGMVLGLIAGIAAVALLVLGVAGYFVARSFLPSPQFPGSGTLFTAGPQYVPEESEKKLMAFFEDMRKTKGDKAVFDITEEQIYAIMGEPTRRETPTTVQKDGYRLTTYKAYWEHNEPNRQISTVIVFVNGKYAGGVIGGEFTPHDSKPPEKPPRSDTPPKKPDQPPVLSRPLADLLVGVWRAELPKSLQPNPMKLSEIRMEFKKDGFMAIQADGTTRNVIEIRGTWQVDRTAANQLWLKVELRRVLDHERLPEGQWLATFGGEQEFESRGVPGVMPGVPCTFRRTDLGSLGIPGLVKPSRPLKDWVRGTWESEGSSPPTPTGQRFPPVTWEFRTDGTFVSTVREPGQAPRTETGTWEALSTFDQTLGVLIKLLGPDKQPRTTYQMRLLFIGEDEMRYLIGDREITPPTFRRKT